MTGHGESAVASAVPAHGAPGRSVSWALTLIDSAWAGSQWEGEAGLQKTKEIGFDGVDLFVGYDPGEVPPERRAGLMRALELAGLPVLSLVCTCLGLSDFNPAVRRFHIDRAKRVVDLAHELDTPRNVLFVPGEYMFQGALIPREEEWKRVVEATHEVGSHAQDAGLELAIELLPFPHAFINDLDSLVRLLDEVALENVKAGVDISHLWLLRTAPEAISRLAGRIAQVHIADCDGSAHGDLPVGRGTTPFVPYLEALVRAGYAGPASVELEFPPEPGEMLTWVSEAYRGAARALADAGVRDPNGRTT
jgi:D-psicose/D-tagatose/L-ribulose 3-epimerase